MSDQHETLNVHRHLLEDLLKVGEEGVNSRVTLRRLLSIPSTRIVDDAGTQECRQPLSGYPRQALRCAPCKGKVNPYRDLCGCTGYRSVCTHEVCYEHGCSIGTGVPSGSRPKIGA